MKFLDRKQVEADYQQGMQNKEFDVYLQPKFDTRSEHIVGAEALIRRNKNGKQILPQEFIPIYEKTGVITKLDMWVLEQVCKTINKWKKRNYVLFPISVNESRRHLYHKKHIKELEKIIQDYQIPANYIELEMTESAVVHNIQVAKEAEKKVHKLGFVVAMDDFGTGYSSFHMLRQIEIDVLKIDKKFSDAVLEDERGKIILESIIQMAKRLKIRTVAEGIETKEQVEYLKKIGCDWIQGYYFAKPMPISKFEEIYLKKE